MQTDNDKNKNVKYESCTFREFYNNVVRNKLKINTKEDDVSNNSSRDLMVVDRLLDDTNSEYKIWYSKPLEDNITFINLIEKLKSVIEDLVREKQIILNENCFIIGLGQSGSILAQEVHVKLECRGQLAFVSESFYSLPIKRAARPNIFYKFDVNRPPTLFLLDSVVKTGYHCGLTINHLRQEFAAYKDVLNYNYDFNDINIFIITPQVREEYTTEIFKQDYLKNITFVFLNRTRSHDISDRNKNFIEKALTYHEQYLKNSSEQIGYITLFLSLPLIEYNERDMTLISHMPDNKDINWIKDGFDKSKYNRLFRSEDNFKKIKQRFKEILGKLIKREISFEDGLVPNQFLSKEILKFKTAIEFFKEQKSLLKILEFFENIHGLN
ncbi:MAG: hypothetical protein ACTSXU_15625, partial [Promethearchaeota archaeon]